MTYKLLEKSSIDDALARQISVLFNQLNDQIIQLDIDRVMDHGDNFSCICCWEKDQLIGMASLVTYKVISGYKGIVEDVVVSSQNRGKGIGRKLMELLIVEGQKLQLDEIILFTGHHRKPAIRLYKDLGFNLKESGMYTLRL